MNLFLRLFRTASFLPLAFAGLLSVIFAQTTIIFGAIFYGIAAPRFRNASAAKAEPAAKPSAVPDAPIRTDPQTISLLPLVPITPDSLILLRGEQCYLQENAQLVVHEEHSVHVDGYGGFSVRNRFDGKPRRPRTKPADGRVYVTNMRIVFIGGANVNIHIAQILTLDALAGGVALSFVNEKPMEITTGNPHIALVLRKTISRLAESPTPSG